MRVLNSKKQVLLTWDLPGGPGRGIKIDGFYIYITVGNSHQIHTYTTSGEFVKTIGKKGNRKGEFKWPHEMTVDKNYLYVCDWGHHRIQVFTKHNDLFSHEWGTRGNNDGQFEFPRSIYLSEGVLFIGDQVSVQIFTIKGRFLQRLGTTRGRDEGQFNGVDGVVAINNQLYVSDFINHRIQVFRKHTMGLDISTQVT